MGADRVARPVTVTVVEDMDVVVEGVRSWIASDHDHRAEVVAVADTIEAALSGRGHDADVLVLDLELDKRLVIDRVAELSDAGHRVVVFSVHVRPLIVQAVLAAGACAFIDKHAEKNQFVDTVVSVARDEPFVTRSMAGGMLEDARLSGREREAVLLLFQGLGLKSIAKEMTKPGTDEPISIETVKQYIKRARAKYAAAGRPCRSNFALLARCIEDGLIR